MDRSTSRCSVPDKVRPSHVVTVTSRYPATISALGVMKAMQFNRNIDKPIIIVLTNFPSPIVQRNAIALGADYFLDKSFEFNKLLGLIYSIAEAKKATSASTEL